MENLDQCLVDNMTSNSRFLPSLPLPSPTYDSQQESNALPVVVWEADQQGHVNWLSTRWQGLTGRFPADSLGETFWDSIAEADRESSRHQWQVAFHKQQAFEMLLNLYLIDGNLHSVIVQGEPRWDDQNQQSSWMGTLQIANTAIPLRSELDYSQKFLQAVLDNLSNGIVACDAQGILTLFNRATQELHGLPLHAVPPEQWADFYDLYEADGKTPLPQDHIPLYRALQGESVQNAEMVIKSKQGPARTIFGQW